MATAAQDKHKEVRRAAEVALSAIHRHLDSAAVAEVLSSEPPDAQAGLLRNLQVSMVPDGLPAFPLLCMVARHIGYMAISGRCRLSCRRQKVCLRTKSGHDCMYPDSALDMKGHICPTPPYGAFPPWKRL